MLEVMSRENCTSDATSGGILGKSVQREIADFGIVTLMPPFSEGCSKKHGQTVPRLLLSSYDRELCHLQWHSESLALPTEVSTSMVWSALLTNPASLWQRSCALGRLTIQLLQSRRIPTGHGAMSGTNFKKNQKSKTPYLVHYKLCYLKE